MNTETVKKSRKPRPNKWTKLAGNSFHVMTEYTLMRLWEVVGDKEVITQRDYIQFCMFEDVDMERQRGKQKAFLTMAFGGPHNYTGTDMRTAHAPLVARGLNDSHFDAVAENLSATLQELGVGQELIDQVMAIAGSTRKDVLGR